MSALTNALFCRVCSCQCVDNNVGLPAEAAHIVVGTPGRVLSQLRDGALRSDAIQIAILGNAGEMSTLFERGHKDSIDVLSLIPPKCQMGLFLDESTMSQEVQEIADIFMRNPIQICEKICIARDFWGGKGIKQFYVMVDREEWKLDTLCDLYETLTITQCIIYVNTRRKVDWLVDKMQAEGFTVFGVHAEMERMELDIIMRAFRNGSSRFLIATGLHVSHHGCLCGHQLDVSLVINYDLPTNHETYIHRITPAIRRFGRKGHALNFLTQEDVRTMREIEQVYNTTVEEMPMNIADLTKQMAQIGLAVRESFAASSVGSKVPSEPRNEVLRNQALLLVCLACGLSPPPRAACEGLLSITWLAAFTTLCATGT